MKTRSGWIPTEAGLRLYYEEWGGAGTETLLLPAASWLATEYISSLSFARLLSYDSRGRGQSDPDPDAAHVWTDYEVPDLETLRQALAVDTFTLIGWSYHGGVAALYAARYPERVRRLVLVCPVQPRYPAPYDNDEEEARLRALRRNPVLAERVEHLRAQGLESHDPVAFCRVHGRLEWAQLMGKPEALEAMQSDPCRYPNEWPNNWAEHWRRHFPESSFHRDWRPQLVRLTMPTLVIHGTADLLPEEASREWVATLPNARLLRLPGIGHLPHLEAAEVFFPAIEAFVAGAWPPDAIRIAASR